MIPKILIVEDTAETLNDIIGIIDDLDEDFKIRFGVERFEKETALWYSAAKMLLRNAGEKNTPYDILVLDLALPEDEPTSERLLSQDDTKWGLNLLKLSREINAVKEIIIYSHFSEFPNISEAFHHGALDFLHKSASDEELQRVILTAWERVLAKMSSEIFEDRIKLLASYTEKGIIHSFSKCFSQLIQSIHYEVGNSAYLLSERLGLDSERDTHDPLIKSNLAIASAIDDAKNEWTLLQTQMAFEEIELRPIGLRACLEDILNKLDPCLTTKHVQIKLDFGEEVSIYSFSRDVSVIMEEIILGALGEIVNNGAFTDEEFDQSIDIITTRSDDYVNVEFIDRFALISPNIAEQINRSFRIENHNRFGRSWGLSIVSQLALRGGGKLQVEASQVLTKISYQLPLAKNE